MLLKVLVAMVNSTYANANSKGKNDEHGRTGRKKLGGRKQICPNFPDFARQVPKIFYGDNCF
jgi:hypothetical protein